MNEISQSYLDSLLNGHTTWPKHEWIVSGSPNKKHEFEVTPTFGKPIWNGSSEPITLLINADFGVGDTIHFFRFIHLAQQKVLNAILRCDGELRGLLTGIQIIDKDQDLPNFDKIIHMMALPGLLDVKIDGKPYLQQNRDSDICQEIDKLSFFKLGVCWAGNPFNPRDAVRSIPLEMFNEIIPEGMRPFCLNKVYDPPENYLNMRGYMKTWLDTSKLVSSMDLIITVDTALAHLSGALGKETWLLLSDIDPDWRWGLKGEKTIWYDSVKLFRGNWKDVINNVRDALQIKLSLSE